MSPGGYAEAKRRRHSRSRSPRDDREKRPKGDKKSKKDKKRVEEEPSRRKRARSRSRDDRDDRRDRGDRGEKGDDGRRLDVRREDGRREDARNEDARRERGDRSTPQAAPTSAQQPEEAVLGRTPSKTVFAPGELPQKQASKWREEMAQSTQEGSKIAEKDEASDDDEAAIERALTESRARREALIAKWVNRGDEIGSVTNLDTPMTGMGGEEDEISDGEVADADRLAARGEMNEEQIKEKKDVARFIMKHKAEHDGDMFDADADEESLQKKRCVAESLSQTGASAEDWDDREGYYKAQIGEAIGGRYLVTEDRCGMGVFSGVVKATDQETNMPVAIKVMRCNDMMRKVAEKEVEILERCNKADKGNKRHVIRLMRHFMYRGHMCLVFECMWDNLRVALKKYTKDAGMSLPAVRAYTKQLLVALRHIHRCDIIHADIKPDNILISAGHNVVKICDLGSAMDLTEVEVTPYLVSLWYRAPEIVLGKEYGCPIDTFAMGATLVELFCGKVLFPARTSNDMLRCIMEIKGKLPHKFIKSGTTWKQHFTEDMDFKYLDTNKVTRKRVTRVITDCSQKRTILDMVMARVGPERQKSEVAADQMYVKKAKQFADLMDKMTALDPERRITPHDALSHPFVVEAFGSAGDKPVKPGKGPPPGKK